MRVLDPAAQLGAGVIRPSNIRRSRCMSFTVLWKQLSDSASTSVQERIRLQRYVSTSCRAPTAAINSSIAARVGGLFRTGWDDLDPKDEAGKVKTEE